MIRNPVRTDKPFRIQDKKRNKDNLSSFGTKRISFPKFTYNSDRLSRGTARCFQIGGSAFKRPMPTFFIIESVSISGTAAKNDHFIMPCSMAINLSSQSSFTSVRYQAK